MELYVSDFLVLATGENNEGYIPKVLGLEKFKGEIFHSSEYKSGEKYQGKNVLVVGSGNSGMEISFDLSNYGSSTSIVVRSPEVTEVVVIGAGPSGLAISACLNKLSIKNVVLEKEDCCGYLWKKKTYDRLHLHLSKVFCSLPYKLHATSSPKYMPKKEFIEYLDEYVEKFNIKPKFQSCVELAFFNNEEKKWNVQSRNVASGEMELYVCDFLVLATGENNEGYIPKVLGLENFKGEIIHSSDYKSGKKYEDKKVLVVGSGNSGMEIAFDLSIYGSHTSIVVRSPVISHYS
ncbi:putative indole-3-pyruvate monooxygenase YUCCA10 [Capsicum annuum]|uniref:Flavin-containing monooxygenase n=1 Tax=Capsicum annuum TaxID=4072 RepID=A0A2G2YF03_CAPAN|nr:putative indole-3-pyruvate monooxygenase YUCCA10 [Capsicum annuum]